MDISVQSNHEPLVLVVDDEDVVRTVAVLLLQHAGFRVVTAATAGEALAVAAAEEPDAVLLDVMLPDRGGGTVATDLRQLQPDLPIIVSSGYDEQTVTQRIGQIPDAHFLRKPYAANDLVAVLDDALRR